MKIQYVLDTKRALREMNATVKASRDAVVAGTKEVTDQARDALKLMTRAAFQGGRLPNTWHRKFYENDGFKSAGFIYNTAPKILKPFATGAVIKSSHGFFLAIPTKNAPTHGKNGKRISPSNFQEDAFGKLRFVYRPGKPALLVVDNVRASYSRKTGQLRGFKKATDKSVLAGKVATTVMFVLQPQVTLKKRIDPDAVVKAAVQKIPGSILRNLKVRV